MVNSRNIGSYQQGSFSFQFFVDPAGFLKGEYYLDGVSQGVYQVSKATFTMLEQSFSVQETIPHLLRSGHIPFLDLDKEKIKWNRPDGQGASSSSAASSSHLSGMERRSLSSTDRVYRSFSSSFAASSSSPVPLQSSSRKLLDGTGGQVQEDCLMIVVQSRLWLVNDGDAVATSEIDHSRLLNEVYARVKRAGHLRPSVVKQELEAAKIAYAEARSFLERVQKDSPILKALQEEIERGQFELALKELMPQLLPSVSDQSELKTLVEISQEKEPFVVSLLDCLKPEAVRTAVDFFIRAVVSEIHSDPIQAIDSYLLLNDWHDKQGSFHYCYPCIEKALSLAKTLKDPFASANVLERLNRTQLESLVAKTGLSSLQHLCLQKDVVRMVFEEWLKQIDRASPQIKNPECFICFALEKEVGQWLEQTFVPDLDLVGVKPQFCFRDLVVGKDLNDFQALARTADLLAIICTPTIKQKCEERTLAPIGVAQELRIAMERFNDSVKHETIFPIYLKGDRRSACPSVFIEPIFGTKFNVEGNILSYYSHAFELFGAMRQLPRETARKMKAAFLEECREVLAKDIDSSKVEMWRSQQSAKRFFLKKSIDERVSSKVRMINCPPPPLHFTGRKEKLNHLHQRCQSHRRVAVTGLGGVGKTSLALKYAEQYQAHYQFIHFIYGSTSQLVTEGLLKLADELQIAGSNAEERLTALKRQLNRLEYDYLLIIDGVDHTAVFEELSTLLPERGKCILLISRMPHQANALDFEVIDLAPLKREEAVDYLVHVTKNNDREGAARLAETLGNLPLALTHAAAYIAKRGQSFAAYLEQFDKFRLQLFDHKRLNLGRNKETILTTWKVSIEAIEQNEDCPLAIDLLNFLSFLGQTSIPLNLMMTWFKKCFPSHSELDFTDAMAALQEYSMIGSSFQDLYDVHLLVQEVTRFQLTPAKQQEILEQGLQTFCELTEGLDLSTLQTRRSFDVFVPHIEKFIHYIPEHFPNEVSLIKILQALWKYDDCDGKYKNAEAVARLYLGRCQSKSIDQARALNFLGFSLMSLGYFQEALKYLLEALELSKELLGEKHPNVATSLNNVGGTYGDLGNHQEALRYLLQALELSKELLGEKHPHVATSLNNVGGTYGDLGNHQEALRYKMQALELRKELLGEKHPDVTASWNNVGGTYRDLGNHQEALKYVLQALELDKELLGEKHPNVAKSLNNVGMTYRDLGNHQESLGYLTESFKILCEGFAKEHPYHQRVLENLINCLSDQTSVELVQKTKEEIFPLAIEKLGQEHSLVEALQKI